MNISKSLIAPYINTMFKGVRPGWRKILLSATLKPILNKCYNKIDEYLINHSVTNSHILENEISTYIKPKPDKIFEAFKYFDPNNMVAIIIDPYPGLNENNNSELARLSRQGVLLLNRYLTRSPNIKKHDDGEIWVASDSKFQLHEFWGEYTNALMIYIIHSFMNSNLIDISINHDKHYLAIILSYKIVQILSTFIDKNPKNCKIDFLECCSTNLDKFIHCDHLIELNNRLDGFGYKKINWDFNYLGNSDLLNQFYYCSDIENRIHTIIENGNDNLLYNDYSGYPINQCIDEYLTFKKSPPIPIVAKQIGNPITVAVDGGCLNNGAKNAKASYSAYFPKKFNNNPNGMFDLVKDMKIYGLVPNNLLQIDTTSWVLKDMESDYIKATNCRGELLGLIHAFIQIIKRYQETHIKRSIYIIADAEYSILLITSRIWSSLKRDIDLKFNHTNRD